MKRIAFAETGCIAKIHARAARNNDGAEGRVNMQIIDAAYQSSQTDQVVQIK